VNIYGLAPIHGGCHWYRIREPLRGLAGRGHVTEFGDRLDEGVVSRNETILAHILHNEDGLTAWRLLAGERQHRLVYDIDDNIWAYEPGTDHADYWTRDRQELAEECIRLSHLVTTPSRVIADIIAYRLNLNTNVAVLPNYVPAWVRDIPRTPPDVFTVAYQGAPQRIHQSDLDTVQVELFEFMRLCPDARLKFYGQPAPLEGGGPFSDRIDFVPWEPSVPDYYRSLAHTTIGIGPLRRSPFTAAKSGLRAVEFAALGVPAILSDAPPYRGTIAHRESGYLVAGQRDWRRYLVKLYRSQDLVSRIGIAARRLAGEWTTEGNAWQWEQAYERSGPGVAAVSSA
jgi:glycosyltransferase involved in cell wall biosynthesis